MSVPPPHFNHHSRHVAMPQDDALQVAWEKVVRRCDRIRVQEHTCMCKRPVYELCAAGGLSFIRRLSGNGLRSVVQSEWMPARAAHELWMQILSGYAR
jgi:hypothetical protein